MRHRSVAYATVLFASCLLAGIAVFAAGNGEVLSPSAPPAHAQSAASVSDPNAFLTIKKREFQRTVERPGVLRPLVLAHVRLRMEEYSGELLLSEILPSGEPVGSGSIIAKLDTRAILEQITQAELDHESQKVRHNNVVEQARLEQEAAARELEVAIAGLERAKKSLEGWLSKDLEFAHRSADLGEQQMANYIEDQKDELAQLELMYGADELTDATEEIVLKRSRRDLASTVMRAGLQKEQRAHYLQLDEPMQVEARKESVETQRLSLERLRRRQDLDRLVSADSLRRSEVDLRKSADRLEELRRDLQLFTIRADKKGTLIHGDSEEFRPGSAPALLRAGDSVAQRRVLFTIAEPDRFEVALEVPESEVRDLGQGGAVEVIPVAQKTMTLHGPLRVERIPSARSAGQGESTFDARVALEKPLPGFAPGMRVQAKLSLPKLEQVIVLPQTAVGGAGEQAWCYAATPGSAEFQRVSLRLGPTQGHEVVVYGELKEESRVLLCQPK